MSVVLPVRHVLAEQLVVLPVKYVVIPVVPPERVVIRKQIRVVAMDVHLLLNVRAKENVVTQTEMVVTFVKNVHVLSVAERFVEWLAVKTGRFVPIGITVFVVKPMKRLIKTEIHSGDVVQGQRA